MIARKVMEEDGTAVNGNSSACDGPNVAITTTNSIARHANNSNNNDNYNENNNNNNNNKSSSITAIGSASNNAHRTLLRRLFQLIAVALGAGFGSIVIQMKHMDFASPMSYSMVMARGGNVILNDSSKNTGTDVVNSSQQLDHDANKDGDENVIGNKGNNRHSFILVETKHQEPASEHASSSFSSSSAAASFHQEEVLSAPMNLRPSYHEMHKKMWTTFDAPSPSAAVLSVAKNQQHGGDDDNNSKNNHLYRSRSEAFREFNSTVQFIFTVGLEGTGHHLMGTIAKESPAVQRLKNLTIWSRETIGALHDRLWNHEGLHEDWKTTKTGLWNAHCCASRIVPLAEMEQDVVKRLQAIETKANNRRLQQQEQEPASPTTITSFPLPVNTVGAGAEKYGEVSYPNYMGRCRPLAYPDLNLLYNACRKAKVDCFQVYVHRHPLEIMNSVIRRGFDKASLTLFQMYIADLHVMANQIRMYASKTLGCFDFFNDDIHDRHSWMEAMKDLWAWTDDEAHRAFMGSVYQAPSQKSAVTETTDEQFAALLSKSPNAPYIQSWWDAHRHVVQQCRQAIKTKERGPLK